MPSPTRPKTTPTPLPAGGVRSLLRSFGGSDQYGNPAAARTGRLDIRNGSGKGGSLFLRSGRVYSAALDGFTPPVALRLLSAGLLTEPGYTALADLPAPEVSRAAVAQGLCSADDVEDIHRQMLMSTVTHMYGWTDGTWSFDDGATTEDYTISGLETSLLAAAADERVGQWGALERNYPAVTRSTSVPEAGPEWANLTGRSTTPEIAAILTYVDGTTTLAQIAAACGFTRFEIAARLAKAIADGILVVPDTKAPKSSKSAQDFDIPEANLDSHQYAVDVAAAAVADAEQSLADARQRLHEAVAARDAARLHDRPTRPKASRK